jgi:hypothetical protein
MPRGARPLLLRRWLALAALAVVPASAFGCGPSYQAIHEGDARFEHCYAIDEGAAASMDDKSKCWHDYREHYAFGQARDRLTYAARREQLLTRSQTLPTDEAMMEAAPGQVAVVPNAPAPTNAFIPPPQMLQQQPPPGPATTSMPTTAAMARYQEPGRDAGAAPISATPPREAPGATCATHCADDWHACEKSCIGAKGPQMTAGTAAKAACDRCDKTHRTCMAACFR